MKKESKYDLAEIKKEATKGALCYQHRGLFHTSKWLAELTHSLKYITVKNPYLSINCKEVEKCEYDKYLLAFSYFSSREYERCAHHLSNTKGHFCRFLKYYALYMNLEMKRLCNATDQSMFMEAFGGEEYFGAMTELSSKMKNEYIHKTMDGFTLYVYGLVLKRLDQTTDAKDILIEAINETPLNWSAWLELIPLIPDKNCIESLPLPNHWMKDFFLGNLLSDLQLSQEALDVYNIILDNGFQKFLYLHTQIAICQYNVRNEQKAIETFKMIRKEDPHRLESMELYSNLLYIESNRIEMVNLAHNAIEADTYKPETSCIVGNYYSLKGDHIKALLNFQRAVKLNPYFVSAWTLMGHEYMELRNTSGAILSYRKSISTNPRDYRAWYGMGQTYEVLRMPCYAIYYFKIAQKLKPTDCRMLLALGEIYERLEKLDQALKCYISARTHMDCEPVASVKAAKLLERMDKVDYAATLYNEIVAKDDPKYIYDNKGDYALSCIFLTTYHLSRSEKELASKFAHLLLANIPEYKDEAEKLLARIDEKDDKSIIMECQSLLPPPTPPLDS